MLGPALILSRENPSEELDPRKLSESTFRRFAANFFLLKMVSVIFTVLEVSFCALTTVVKVPWKF